MINSPEKEKEKAARARMLAVLNAFLCPIAKATGAELRPFSITSFLTMQTVGICIGTEQFARMSDVDTGRQLLAVYVIQTAPLREVAAAARACAGNFDSFFFDFVLERAANVPLEALEEVEALLSVEMPAIEAAQIEIQAPPSRDSEDTPPGN